MNTLGIGRKILQILIVISCFGVTFNLAYFGYYNQQGVMVMTTFLWFLWVFIAVGIDNLLEKVAKSGAVGVPR